MYDCCDYVDCYNIVCLFVVVLFVCLCDCGVGWVELNGECIYFSYDKYIWFDVRVSCEVYGKLKLFIFL